MKRCILFIAICGLTLGITTFAMAQRDPRTFSANEDLIRRLVETGLMSPARARELFAPETPVDQVSVPDALTSPKTDSIPLPPNFYGIPTSLPEFPQAGESSSQSPGDLTRYGIGGSPIEKDLQQHEEARLKYIEESEKYHRQFDPQPGPGYEASIRNIVELGRERAGISAGSYEMYKFAERAFERLSPEEKKSLEKAWELHSHDARERVINRVGRGVDLSTAIANGYLNMVYGWWQELENVPDRWQYKEDGGLKRALQAEVEKVGPVLAVPALLGQVIVDFFTRFGTGLAGLVTGTADLGDAVLVGVVMVVLWMSLRHVRMESIWRKLLKMFGKQKKVVKLVGVIVVSVVAALIISAAVNSPDHTPTLNTGFIALVFFCIIQPRVSWQFILNRVKELSKAIRAG